MSGTSCDGVDAACVRLAFDGPQTRCELVGFASVAFGAMSRELLEYSHGATRSAEAVARLLTGIGRSHEAVIARAIAESGSSPDLISCHGQTLHHKDGQSWQAFAPAAIARRFGAPVVYDLRSADIAAGGAGAPITPIADRVLFEAARPAIVVNLGGFCNLTVLGPDGAVAGRDVCTCNQLLNAAADRFIAEPFDRDGDAASAGSLDTGAAQRVRRTIEHTGSRGRSLGSGDESFAALDAIEHLTPQDAMATICEGIGSTIGDAVREAADAMTPERVTIVLAGGGAHHRGLVRSIAAHAGDHRVNLSDEFGVPIQAREAMAMAILGSMCLDGAPITLHEVTGTSVPPPVSGVWCLPPDGSWRIARTPLPASRRIHE